MSTFQSGSAGINLLSSLLSFGTISSETFSSTEAVATYTSGIKGILYGNFTVNSSGTGISGGTLTGWSVFSPNGQLEWSITGASASVQTIALDGELGLNTQVTQLVLPVGSTYIGSSNTTANDILIGFSGGDTFIGGAATELFEPSAGTNTITGGTGANTVQFQGAFSAYTVVNNGGGAITVTDSVSSRNGIDHISGVQTLKFTDISATVLANGQLSLPTATVYQASQWANASDIAPLTIKDTSADVLSGLGSLETLATGGKIGSISLTDAGGGFVTLNLTASQVTADAAALKLIGNAVVDVSASAANLSFVGLGEPATEVVFSGKASQYQITATGGGGVTVVDVGTGRTSSDHFANITALKFSDQTLIVAAEPTNSGAATTGNITELYAAAFGREPDSAGLAYYQAELAANPSIPLTTFAQNFLASPEYANNSAHSYAQNTTGETNFITDLYTNLLHRSPESGAIPYYLNILAQYTNGNTTGTQAYASAEAAAHAVVLKDISQSAEFLNNVQLTGQTATSQHWLLVG